MGRAPTALLFEVPTDLIKRFNGDCKRAGIPKRDDRDRTVDIHSLRMTFNTWLANAGVPPRIAQELMRHEDIDITMGDYTDTGLFDLSAAVEALPSVAPIRCTGLVAPWCNASQRMSTMEERHAEEDSS